MNTPKLMIIIPCYNEQEVLPLTAPLFLRKIDQLAEAGKIAKDSRILFVNDGSRDDTWNIIRDLADRDERYRGICPSRNVTASACSRGMFYGIVKRICRPCPPRALLLDSAP